jgi:hypothetical protein
MWESRDAQHFGESGARIRRSAISPRSSPNTNTALPGACLVLPPAVRAGFEPDGACRRRTLRLVPQHQRRYSACNTGTNTPSLPANVNGSGFDFTLGTLSGPNNNTFGSIVITLGPGNGQYALAYMDYDLNFDAEGSYTDVGSVSGTPHAGVSYELDDPGASNIFSDFATNALTDTNNLGTPGTPANPCCDVSWALGVGGLSVAPGQMATITFTVGTSPPAGGFYLQQSNEYDSETIYLSETTTVSPPPSSVPEPSTLAILGTAIFGLALGRRRQ